MTYDWIASTPADALNKDVVVALSPVANVNGVWQYYLDNTRVIKPDGWAISVAGSTPEQIERAAAVFDFFFTEEGRLYQNYGLIEDLDQDDQYVGPDGKAGRSTKTGWSPQRRSSPTGICRRSFVTGLDRRCR
jgi:ABC-type glycerol-3-phosphate transport system substrate-binding protein